MFGMSRMAATQTLTMWIVDLLLARSKLRRTDLPSLATIWPPLISYNTLFQLNRQASGSAAR